MERSGVMRRAPRPQAVPSPDLNNLRSRRDCLSFGNKLAIKVSYTRQTSDISPGGEPEILALQCPKSSSSQCYHGSRRPSMEGGQKKHAHKSAQIRGHAAIRLNREVHGRASDGIIGGGFGGIARSNGTSRACVPGQSTVTLAAKDMYGRPFSQRPGFVDRWSPAGLDDVAIGICIDPDETIGGSCRVSPYAYPWLTITLAACPSPQMHAYHR